MATELKSLFQGQRSALALKAIILALSFRFLIGEGESSFFAICLFLAIALLVYVRPSANAKQLSIAFTTFLFLVIFLGVLFTSPAARNIIAIGVAGITYIILGLKSLFFVYRKTLHYLLVLALGYLSFLVFFSSDSSTLFLIKSAALFLMNVLLWREFYNAYSRMENDRTIWLASSVLGFITVQSAWVGGILPFEALSASNLALLTIFGASNLILRSQEKKVVSKREGLIFLTIFVFFAIFIFATSPWKL